MQAFMRGLIFGKPSGDTPWLRHTEMSLGIATLPVGLRLTVTPHPTECGLESEHPPQTPPHPGRDTHGHIHKCTHTDTHT